MYKSKSFNQTSILFQITLQIKIALLIKTLHPKNFVSISSDSGLTLFLTLILRTSFCLNFYYWKVGMREMMREKIFLFKMFLMRKVLI